MIGLALALALQTTSGAAAFIPAATTAQQRSSQTPQQQLEALGNLLKAQGMSAEGIRKVQAGTISGAQQLHSFAPRMQAAKAGVISAAQAKPFNASRFEEAIRTNMQLDAELIKFRSDHQIELFHSLSPADQKILAMAIATSAQNGPGGH